MALDYTTDQVKALAPDDSSAKAGRGLASPAKWESMGRDDRAVWGECKGSGAKPYQVEIDLADQPAFKCSCPSRKFPCKHALGLMFLLAEKKAAIAEIAAPPWVADWLESRSRRVQQREERKEQAAKLPDPETREKKLAKRRERIASGLADLDLWLRDLVRGGLAAIRSRPHSYWSEPAARLVDSQAPGLARWIESLEQASHSGDGWEEAVLRLLGRIALVVEGFSRFDSLSPKTQADLRAVVGWPFEKDEVLAGPDTARDRWAVVGMSIEEAANLREQRIWLQGLTTRRSALILDFAYENQPLDVSLPPGTGFEGELAFYPGGSPLRALVKDRTGGLAPLTEFPGFALLEDGIDAFAKAFAENPWIGRFPFGVHNLRPRRSDHGWMIRDGADRELPLTPEFRHGWDLLAVSGGRPLSLFGEWSETAFRPLSGWVDGRFFSWPHEGVVS